MSMKPPGIFEPRLSHEQPILWLPSTGADATGSGLGPAWAAGADAVVSHPTPTGGITTKFRRTRFTSPAIANKHLGILFANADHACCYRGDIDTAPTPDYYRGGFYFRAVFMVNAIPDTAVRFFAGLSAQTGTGVAVSNTVPNNSVGLWCDSGDAGNLTIVTVNNTGGSTKTALATPSTPRTLTAGILYEFIMIANPAQNVIVTALINAGDTTGGHMGTSLNFTNTGATMPLNTVMMAPQVGLGNAAHAAGGDCSLDIINVYVRPNMRLLQP